MQKHIWGMTALLTLAAAGASAEDIEGAKDFRFIERYPGSSIIQSEQTDMIEFIYPTGVNARGNEETFAHQTYTGDNRTLIYEIDDAENLSPLKVFSSFTAALKKAGFSQDIACSGAKNECGYFFLRQLLNSEERESHYEQLNNWRNFVDNDFYFYAGQLKQDNYTNYVLLTVNKDFDRIQYSIDLLDNKPAELESLKTDTSAIKADMAPAPLADNSSLDKPGTGDFSFISRFPSSYIKDEVRHDFISYIYPSTVNSRDAEDIYDARHISGQNRTLVYRFPDDSSVSTLKVFRTMEHALTQAGFRTDISCSGKKEQCGYLFLRELANTPEREEHFRALASWQNMNADNDFYLYSGTLAYGDRNYYTLMVVTNTGKHIEYAIDVLQEERFSSEQKELTGDKIQQDMDETGHVILSGIQFEKNETRLLPASDKALSIVAEYIKSHPESRYLIVGHTDNIGNAAFNQSLSEGRANSVADALAEKYKVGQDLLTPVGVGFSSPVTNNSDEKSRNINRRIELVRY